MMGCGCTALLALIAVGANGGKRCSKTFPSMFGKDDYSICVDLSGCGGYIDYSDMLDELVQRHLEEKPIDKLSPNLNTKEWFTLYMRYFSPGVQRWPGMDGYEPAVAIHIAQGVRVRELHAEDAQVLAELAKRKVLRRVQFLDGAWCRHSDVGCLEIDGQIRVTAIAIKLHSGIVNAKLVELLCKLSTLQGLAVWISNRVRFEEHVITRLSWPHLKTLEFDIERPIDPQLQNLLHVVGRFVTLQSLAIISEGGPQNFDSDLTAFCNLVGLRQLSLANMNIHTIPNCIGRFSELRVLDLRGNFLTEAPQAISNLPELRSFVGFHQGEHTLCDLEDSLDIYEDLQLQHGNCKPTFETKVGISEEEDVEGHMICPWLAIRGTLHDWMHLQLPKLEKLWLDGNFISGGLPESLPQMWPQMRSLDLYNNELTGQIPMSWTKIQWQKLQLQDNYLSGNVPPGFFDMHCCCLNIGLNAALTGCLHSNLTLPEWGATHTNLTSGACHDNKNEL